MHPILFQFAGVTVYSYGVCQVLSYLAFAGLLIITAKRLAQPFFETLRPPMAMVAGALIGGLLVMLRLKSGRLTAQP